MKCAIHSTVIFVMYVMMSILEARTCDHVKNTPVKCQIVTNAQIFLLPFKFVTKTHVPKDIGISAVQGCVPPAHHLVKLQIVHAVKILLYFQQIKSVQKVDVEKDITLTSLLKAV